MRIGIDFGGTQIKVAAVADGDTVKEAKVDTPKEQGADAVVDRIVEAVKQLEVEPTTVGLAIPGHVDSIGMIWRLPNVPGFEGMKIAESLQEKLGCRVDVENDATAAALGENLFGRGRGFETFLMITLGTGVGGGLIVNNTLVRGTHGFTAEIGHMRIDRGEASWPCGLSCSHQGHLYSVSPHPIGTSTHSTSPNTTRSRSRSASSALQRASAASALFCAAINCTSLSSADG